MKMQKILTTSVFAVMCTLSINTNSFAQTAWYDPQTGQSGHLSCGENGVCPEVAISRPIPMQPQPGQSAPVTAPAPTKIGIPMQSMSGPVATQSTPINNPSMQQSEPPKFRIGTVTMPNRSNPPVQTVPMDNSSVNQDTNPKFRIGTINESMKPVDMTQQQRARRRELWKDKMMMDQSGQKPSQQMERARIEQQRNQAQSSNNMQ